ncbi:type IV pilin [Halorientalis brevis]|uniref:Type IV pilin n=1 Tax=Halorientalis brevis TaxID=1126241 RepID=A0ABD6CE10_9EURY|nr:type IV pilin [Halorientalis brevis]
MFGDRDTSDSFVGDQRAVTINNVAAVATLLVFTVVIGGGLGAAVLFAEEEDTGPPSANFTFNYFDESDTLLVTKEEGDRLPAGELLVTNGNVNVTWAAVANVNNTTRVKQGDGIQLSRGSAFSRSVSSTDKITIYWTGGNETRKLDEWTTE